MLCTSYRMFLLNVNSYVLNLQTQQYYYFTKNITTQAMIQKTIYSTIVNIPIYVPKRPQKLLKIHFPPNNTLYIRLVKVSNMRYLQITIFGQETLSFYYYDLFKIKTLKRLTKSLFQNTAELLDQLFLAETKRYCIKWPNKNANAFVEFNYFKNQQNQSILLQVSRRIKNVDTLLSLRLQKKLLSMKQKYNLIIQAEKKLKRIQYESTFLQSSNGKYQSIDLVESSQQQIDIETPKRYDSLKYFRVDACKIIFTSSSYNVSDLQDQYSPQKQSGSSYQIVDKSDKQLCQSSKHNSLSKTNSLLSSKSSQLDLDFSKSQYILHFEIVNEHNNLVVTKSTPQKKFFHLHHRLPIARDIQEFKLRPEVNAYNDLTFGVLGASALKHNRMEWPKQIIAYIGCTYQIMNGLIYQKIPVTISNGDLLVVQVHLLKKKVYFLWNNQPLGKQQILGQQMANECYFFYQTSTQGNSVIFPLIE